MNAVHPCQRWFQWNGEHGAISYYDKQQEQNVNVPIPCAFIVLDRMATVKGWHDASDSGIYANEVRDTTKQPLVVKAFKGGVLAEGFYSQIKDRVGNLGGNYVAVIYVAFKDTDGQLHIGALQFKGAALGAWMEFEKQNRKGIWEKAVRITGSKDGVKGKVHFKTPMFALAEVSDETNNVAKALDVELQEYLDAYLRRNTKDQAHPQTEAGPVTEQEPDPEPPLEMEEPERTSDDDVPF